MNTTKEHSRFIDNTCADYDMARWKVEEIYELYWPEKFYEKLEEAIKQRERMPECRW